jgi:hypothetical protein
VCTLESFFNNLKTMNMALFNKLKNKEQMTINRAGGQAFVQDPKIALVSVLLTSFVQDQYYRSTPDTLSEVRSLMEKVDALFAAKAAVFARNEFGMRSISHIVAAEIAPYLSGKSWAKEFYKAVVYRPDDMMEILAYYYANNGKSITNAMRKGFSMAFDKFDAYQLAKYRANKRAVKLIDVVNLVHPIPTLKNANALQALVKGELRAINTWESKISKAGQDATSESQKDENKKIAWAELILNRKIGYFALLRNLRNIIEQAPEVLGEALEIVTNERAIKSSKVLPFRFMTAMKAIEDLEMLKRRKRRVLKALEQALNTSVSNIPEFSGTTLVVLDDSGSMTYSVNRSSEGPIVIGALIASAIYKSNNADLMRFSDNASYVNTIFLDATYSIAKSLIRNARAAGTNFHSIFEKAKRRYDRIIILSDMQGWIGYHTPTEAFETYKKKFDVNPFIYSFDLQGYGSMQFPSKKVLAISGFSEKIFDIMKVLEQDRNALINKIEAVEF